jgi:hypothetical protein
MSFGSKNLPLAYPLAHKPKSQRNRNTVSGIYAMAKIPLSQEELLKQHNIFLFFKTHFGICPKIL